MKKRILITGAGGFLGSNLIKEGLNHPEYELWAATSNPDKIYRIIGDNSVKVVSREWPLTDDFSKYEFECVIHCAFPRNTDGEEFAKGLDYCEDLFKSFAKSNVKSIINISSQSVYDDQRIEPATEESRIVLKTPYAVGKYMVEKLLDAICKNIPHINLRMSSLIGPQFNQRVVNRLIKSAIENGEIHIAQNQSLFGFFDIDDAVDAIYTVISSYMNWDDVYNVGTENVYSLMYIATSVQTIVSSLTKKPIIVEDNIECEEYNSGINAQKFCKEFEFKPKYSLMDSIKKIAEIDYRL